MEAALQSWKSALRPLDTKFQGFAQLLVQYNVNSAQTSSCPADSIRLEFLRFILSGRSTVAGNASSALDQFFTRATMHDQLLQREARGVESSVASMEGAFRSQVLSSIRAVVYEAEELYGRAKAQTTNDSNLIDPEVAPRLYASTRVLFLTFDQCLGYVIEARTRLHDLLAWMRGTASQVRAWGTASDSMQRQNARARRISNGVVQRVSDFLSRTMMFESKGLDEVIKEGRIPGGRQRATELNQSFHAIRLNEMVALSHVSHPGLCLTRQGSGILPQQGR